MLSWHLAISDSDREYAKQFIDPTRKNLIISPCSSKSRERLVGGALCGSGKYCSSTSCECDFCSSPAKRELEMVKNYRTL